MRLQVFLLTLQGIRKGEIIQTQLIFNKHISYED